MTIFFCIIILFVISPLWGMEEGYKKIGSLSQTVSVTNQHEVPLLKKLCLIKCADLIHNDIIREQDITKEFADYLLQIFYEIDKNEKSLGFNMLPELKGLKFVSADHKQVFICKSWGYHSSKIVNRQTAQETKVPGVMSWVPGTFLPDNKCVLIEIDGNTKVHVYNYKTKQSEAIFNTASIGALCQLKNNLIGWGSAFSPAIDFINLSDFSRKRCQEIQKISTHKISIHRMAGLNNDVVALGSGEVKDGIYIWDYAQDTLIKKLPLEWPTSQAYHGIVSHNNTLAIYGFDGISIFDVAREPGQELIADFEGRVCSARFDQTGQYIIAGTDKNRATLWFCHIPTQQAIFAMLWPYQCPLSFISISADNTSIIIRDGDGNVGEIENVTIDFLQTCAVMKRLKDKFGISK